MEVGLEVGGVGIGNSVGVYLKLKKKYCIL